MSESNLVATARAMVAPGKGIFAADMRPVDLTRGRWGSTAALETDENVYDFQEMFCRTPEIGEHLSSLIVFPEILDRTGYRFELPDRLSRWPGGGLCRAGPARSRAWILLAAVRASARPV